MNNNHANEDNNDVEEIHQIQGDEEHGGEVPPAAAAQAQQPQAADAQAPANNNETGVPLEVMRQQWTYDMLALHRVIVINASCNGPIGWCPIHHTYSYISALCFDCSEEQEEDQAFVQPYFNNRNNKISMNPIFLLVIGKEPEKLTEAMGNNKLGESREEPRKVNLQEWFLEANTQQYNCTQNNIQL